MCDCDKQVNCICRNVRRNISRMIESNELTNEEIRMFAGHEDFSTTEKFYNYPTVSLDKRADAFERAIG